jgi:hypothetical protein
MSSGSGSLSGEKQGKPGVVADGYAAFDERDNPLVEAETEVLADCSITVFPRKALQTPGETYVPTP